MHTGYKFIIQIGKGFMITQTDSNIEWQEVQKKSAMYDIIGPVHMGRSNFTWNVCLSYLIKVLAYITWIINSTFLSNKDITIEYWWNKGLS